MPEQINSFEEASSFCMCSALRGGVIIDSVVTISG